jgi:hypothetical protein
LQLDDSMDFTEFDYQGKDSTRCGNRPLEAKTLINLETFLRQFWRYCIIRGDYDSILILLSPAPQNVPAMKLETVDEFLRFKRMSVNSPLTTTYRSSTTNNQVKDVFGDPIFTEGGWKAPKNEMIYAAAIANLHYANNHTSEYTDACEDCRAKPANEQYQGCRVHAGCPRLLRKGNPVSHETYKNVKKQLIKDDHDYKELGSMQLLPVDLRMLRSYLLGTPNILNLQTWVIIIFSSLLFLRYDEFHDITGENFQPELFSLPKATKTINSLVL